MRKVIAALSGLSYFLYATTALAQAINITLAPPPGQGISPNTPISEVLGNIIMIIFTVAIIVVLFFIIWGAFTWITSSGDKEKVGQARNRIINALIGLAVLALAFLIINVAGQLIRINIANLNLPPIGRPNP